MSTQPESSNQQTRRSPPGFRFSKVDGTVIVLVVVATVVAWPWLKSLALLAPITLFHFFLFCNVFRVRRSLELMWAAVFVLNIVIWFAVDRFIWWYILAGQMPVTLGVLIYEIRSERYHGIFCGKMKEVSSSRGKL